MDVDYTVFVKAGLLLFLIVMYFFHKNRAVHIGCAIGIIVLSLILQFPLLFVLLISVSLFAFSFSFLRRSGVVLSLIVLCLLPGLVFAAKPDVVITPDVIPSAAIDKVKEVEKVKLVEEVVQITAQPRATISGTDYLPFDDGKLMAYLVIGEYPLSTASCFVSVLYPNMSHFLYDQMMVPVNNSLFAGLYYLDFTVPNVTGVYPVAAYCLYNTSSVKVVPVGQIVNGIPIDEGSYDNLALDDESHLVFLGSGVCNNLVCTYTVTFSLPPGYDSQFLYDARLFNRFETDKAGRNFNFSIRNFDTARWDAWYTVTNGGVNDDALMQRKINGSHVNDSNNALQVRMSVYDYDGGRSYYDYSVIYLSYNGSYVGDLRGNSEVVVSDGVNVILEEVTGDIEFVSSTAALSIIILVIAISLLFLGQEHFAGFFLALWAMLYSDNLYITLLVLLLSVAMIWWGVRKKR